jgi:hypothetical protein
MMECTMTVFMEEARVPTGQERFGRLFAWWFGLPDVGRDEIALLAVLCTYADQGGECWPSQERIAADLKMSRPWVIKVISKLLALGLVTTRRFKHQGRVRLSYRLKMIPTADLAVHIPTDEEQKNPAGGECVSARTGPVSGGPGPVTDVTETDSPEHKDSTLPTGGADGGVAVCAKVGVPNNWEPGFDDLEFAKRERPDIDPHKFTRRFKLACRARGAEFAEFSAAWRLWLLNERVGREDSGKSASHDKRFGGSCNGQSAFGPGRRASAGAIREQNDRIKADALERIHRRRGIGMAD